MQDLGAVIPFLSFFVDVHPEQYKAGRCIHVYPLPARTQRKRIQIIESKLANSNIDPHGLLG